MRCVFLAALYWTIDQIFVLDNRPNFNKIQFEMFFAHLIFVAALKNIRSSV